MFYTYVSKSLKDNKLYVGWTSDLSVRVEKHNNREVQSTKDRTPFELIYYEASRNKNDAIAREKQLKTGFGRAYLKRRLSELKK